MLIIFEKLITSIKYYTWKLVVLRAPLSMIIVFILTGEGRKRRPARNCSTTGNLSKKGEENRSILSVNVHQAGMSFSVFLSQPEQFKARYVARGVSSWCWIVLISVWAGEGGQYSPLDWWGQNEKYNKVQQTRWVGPSQVYHSSAHPVKLPSKILGRDWLLAGVSVVAGCLCQIQN